MRMGWQLLAGAVFSSETVVVFSPGKGNKIKLDREHAWISFSIKKN
jgi:hypothetical protein